MWFILSLMSALFAGTSDALAKKSLEKSHAPTVAWVRTGWASLFLLPLLFFVKAPSNPLLFWKTVSVMIPFEIIAVLAFNTAIKISPLSLCIPYIAFTPVFLILSGWLFLGEKLSLNGIAGVICVTFGALILQLSITDFKKAPLKSLLPQEKGPALVLLVAFLFSITTALCKRALVASSPIYFSGVYYLLISLFLLPFQNLFGARLFDLKSQPRLFFALGLTEALGCLAQFYAIMGTKVAYMIAIKRLSLLLSVLYGWYFFKEQNIEERLVGAAFMFAGAVLIAFA
jgi:drug/metabolite transporter (DMT)-like permease